MYAVNICNENGGVKIRLATPFLFGTYEEAENFVKNSNRKFLYTVSIIADLGP